ncbi:hypothetical protein Q7P37_007427 [Cladosporium fusiforme]
MPPKKATTTATKKKAPRADGFNLSYQDMIKEAIIQLKERNGTTRQVLKKYLRLNFPIQHVSDAQFTSLFNRALAKGSESGAFARPKGPSGPVKLGQPTKSKISGENWGPGATTAKKTTATKTAAKKEDAPAAAKKTTKATKATTTKKAPAAKKATAKSTTKATTAKAATAKTTTKKAPAAKANTSKKAAPKAAPAVEDAKPVVMTKTKTGRVVKSAQPQKAEKPKKAAATKKATTKKAAAKK